jgi:hypothetical protein
MLRPFEAYRARRISEVNARYDAVLAQGFATADFGDQPEPETLQCRGELDRTNWLGLTLKAQAMISAGLGDEPCSPPIRCTSNRMYAVTYTDALARMFDLLDRVGRAQANWWRLKDAVRDCPTREGLNDIDLEEGWS